MPWKDVSNNGRNCDTLVLMCHRKPLLSGLYECVTESLADAVRRRNNDATHLIEAGLLLIYEGSYGFNSSINSACAECDWVRAFGEVRRREW